jgi:hypothetical protein
MSAGRYQTRFLGWIGIACIAFTWLAMLAPKRISVLDPVLEVVGPLQWIIPLAMIALAARNASKRWLVVSAVGAITAVVFFFRAMAG